MVPQQKAVLLGASALILAGVLSIVLGWRDPRAPPGAVDDGAVTHATPDGPDRRVQTPEDGDVQRDSVDQQSAAEGRVDEALARLIIDVVLARTNVPRPGVRVSVYALEPSAAFPEVAEYVDDWKGTPGKVPRSDDRGRVEFGLPPGVRVGLWADGSWVECGDANLSIAALDPGESRELRIELTAGFETTFYARLVGADNGAAIPDAGIHTELVTGRSIRDGVHAWAVRNPPTTRSDADGRFELLVSSWRSSFAQVDADGYGPVYLLPNTAHSDPQSPMTVRLSRTAEVRAAVRDAADAPMAGVAVQFSTAPQHLSRPEQAFLYDNDIGWEAITDANGRCAVTGLPSGVPLEIQLRRNGTVLRRIATRIVLEPGKVREVDWKLGEGALLLGVVRLVDGTTVRNTVVALFPADFESELSFLQSSDEPTQQTLTDADGRFRFEDVPSGDWWIGPWSQRDTTSKPAPDSLASVGRRVEIPPGTAVHEVDVIAHRGLCISGIVLGVDGEPKPNVPILCVWNDGHGSFRASCDDDGHFSVGPLAPGSYNVWATGLGIDYVDSRPVTTSAGDEGVVLRLRAGGSLTGRVVDAVTGERCAADLTYSRDGDWQQGFTTTRSLREGFTIEGLEPGIWNIVAKTSSGKIGSVRGISVTAGAVAGEVTITVRQGAEVRVYYEGASEFARFSISRDRLTVANNGVRTGTSALEIVPAGTLEVEIHVGGEVRRKSLEVAPGETADVRFEPAAGRERK